MIKAVLFDVDGVLLDSFEANFQFFQNCLKHLRQPPITRTTYRLLFHMPMTEVLRQTTSGLSETGIETITQELLAIRDQLYPYELLTTPPDTERTLQNLQNIYQLGIVTSRVAVGIYAVPQLALLQKFFSTTVSYEDTTKHKPHPAPLLLAVANLGIKPHEAVYIGDAPTDMQAAITANMHKIYFSAEPYDSTPNTTDFSQLPELINQLVP